MNSISRMPPGPSLTCSASSRRVDVAPHFGVQPAHRAERRVVEVLAVHERTHDGAQLVVCRASQGARLDPGVAFPLATVADQIGLEEVEAADERPRVAVRPQPHVDAEDEAVLGDVGEQPGEAPRERLETLGALGVGMQQDEIDVGGDVELAAAELAHADHHQLRSVEPFQRAGDGQLGEVAHRGADLLQRGAGHQVARHDAEKYPLAKTPQAALECRLVVALCPVQRLRHFGAGKGRGRGQLGAELRPGGEHARGVARKGCEIKWLRHCRLKCRSER